MIKVVQQISRRLKIETYWQIKWSGRKNSPGEDCGDYRLILQIWPWGWQVQVIGFISGAENKGIF